MRLHVCYTIKVYIPLCTKAPFKTIQKKLLFLSFFLQALLADDTHFEICFITPASTPRQVRPLSKLVMYSA